MSSLDGRPQQRGFMTAASLASRITSARWATVSSPRPTAANARITCHLRARRQGLSLRLETCSGLEDEWTKSRLCALSCGGATITPQLS
eukprot:623018-Amphidinium_carterae.1